MCACRQAQCMLGELTRASDEANKEIILGSLHAHLFPQRYEGLPALAVETDKVVALVWQLASTGRVTLPSDTAAMLRSVQEGYSSMLDAAFAALEACDGLSPIVGEAKQAMARGLSAAKEVAEVVLPLAHFRTGLDLEEPNGAPGAEAGDKEVRGSWADETPRGRCRLLGC